MNRRLVLLIAALGGIIAIIYLLSTLTHSGPNISRIVPEAGQSGDAITIEGSGFGSEGSVQIGGRSVPRANIREWAESRIRITVPGPIYSGLVTVNVQGETSNRVLFTNRESAPLIAGNSGVQPSSPFIFSVSPNVSAPGREVTITGRNFGVSSAAGRILIFPDSRSDEELQFFPESYIIPESHILLWSTDTIRFVSPYGVIADSILVETMRGESDPVRYELQDLVGTYQYLDPQEIAFGFSMSAAAVPLPEGDDETAAGASGVENELVLWMPSVPESPFQRGVQYSRLFPSPRFISPETMMFIFSQDELLRHSEAVNHAELLRIQSVVTRYAIETTLLPSRVSDSYRVDNPVYRDYLSDGQGISLTDEIRRDARTLGGNSGNPLTIARTLFAGIRSRLSPAGEEEADSREYASRLTAMLRSRGIPARVITGVLVPPGFSPRYHHWVEWYVLDFGWVPMDPYVADAIQESLPWAEGFTAEPGYYSENLDPFRVEVHRGSALPLRRDHFSTEHVVEKSPLIFNGAAYGHLPQLELELVWNQPLVMYRLPHAVSD